jgi:hypothetical protein
MVGDQGGPREDARVVERRQERVGRRARRDGANGGWRSMAVRTHARGNGSGIL